MRANLARHARHMVVRRASTPSCAAYAIPTRRRYAPRQLASRTFHRNFFDILFKAPPREVRQPEYEPGWMLIMLWRSRMLDNLRPPPREDMIKAWRDLMQSKIRSLTPLNSTQALQCRRLLEHLALEKDSRDDPKYNLNEQDLQNMEQVLLRFTPLEMSKNYLDLGKALHSIWSSGKLGGKNRSPEQQWRLLVRLKCKYGEAQEAASDLYSQWDNEAYATVTKGGGGVIPTIAKGLALEGREQELVELIDFTTKEDTSCRDSLQETATMFFAQRDRVPETQESFAQQARTGQAQLQTYQALASFAMRNNLQEWALPIFLELGQAHPSKRYWDVMLQAVLLLGKSLEDVQVLMSHMMDKDGPLTADTATLNSLLRGAAELADAQLAERAFKLISEKGFRPNAETYLNLLVLYVKSGSMVDARAAYEELQNAGSIDPNVEASAALWIQYRQIMNEHFVLLCKQTPPDFKYLLELLNNVDEERVHLEPEVVASLCIKFLENDQQFDVMDILSIHSFRYSEAQRDVVQAAFVAFCLDPSTSTSRAWGAYQLLQQFFQDTSFERRVSLLQSFFDRRRPDMATHVFTHMRQHRNAVYRPTLDTYIQCLEGFARYPDREGTEQLYNYVKLDTSVQLNTRLNTALMLAHASSEQPLKAMEFWGDITASREGPSYDTLAAVFWVLEKKSGGAKQARQIWTKVEAMDLEVSPELFNAYVGAIAASGTEKELRNLIMKMPSVVGTEPDTMTLGIAYNALPGQLLQKGFQEWAQQHYRSTWAELLKKGRRMTEHELCHFRLNRVLKA